MDPRLAYKYEREHTVFVSLDLGEQTQKNYIQFHPLAWKFHFFFTAK